MRVLINASNIGFGGASQVTSSICEGLNEITQHSFVVVLSSPISQIRKKIENYPNVDVKNHTVSKSWRTKITGREHFLDSLVDKLNIDVVLSVFGPTWWVPRVPHLCGFALAHVVMPESPYFQKMRLKERIKSFINNRIMRFFFHKCSSCFYTENEMISKRLEKTLDNIKVYTVTNYYNQIYDSPERWKHFSLSKFQGKTFVTLAAPYPHKNLKIAKDIAIYLKKKYPNFAFRFILSIEEKDFPILTDELKEHFCFIGQVKLDECPSIYQQSDIVFQPTLLECFTAAYPEAMRMERPIVTTDLSFARGLCGNAAIYYSPLSAQDAAESLYKVSTDMILYERLVANGREQLKKFDNYSDRVKKLTTICESLK